MEETPVTITSGDSLDLGSCNGCDRHITPDGGVPHRVWSFRFAHGPEARLCDGCLTTMGAAMRRVTDAAPPRRPRDMRHHDPLRFAITDGLWDRLEEEGVNGDISDGFWNWYGDAIEKPALTLICEVDGHHPVPDQCDRREHDYCAICTTPMPGAAGREERT